MNRSAFGASMHACSRSKRIISLSCFKKILWVSEVKKLPQIRLFHHLFSPLRWVQMDIETKNLGRAHVCRDKR